MLDNLKKYNIVLASNSPRRRELLAGLGIDFIVKVIADIDESYPDSINASEVAQYIAEKKAKAPALRIAKAELASYSSIADFVYKKMTSVGGLVDTAAELSDHDLEILRRLVDKEIAKRKKIQKGKTNR